MTTRQKIFSVVFFLLFLASGLRAYEGTSIGLIVGKPLGMNFKPWISEMTALNVNFGINPFDNLLFMNADVLRHFDVLYQAPFYVGGGLCLQIDNRTKSDQNFSANLRVVVGEDIWLGESGFALFWEGGGLGTFYDGVWFRGGRGSFDWTAAIGVHYYLSH